MSNQTQQATLITLPEWSMFSVHRVRMQDQTGIKLSHSLNAEHGITKLVGTPEGTPQFILSQNEDKKPAYLTNEDVESDLMFGEYVTRSDGKTMTIMEILEEKLLAFAARERAKAPVPPPQ